MGRGGANDKASSTLSGGACAHLVRTTARCWHSIRSQTGRNAWKTAGYASRRDGMDIARSEAPWRDADPYED